MFLYMLVWTFLSQAFCKLVIRQFESWKLTATGIIRMPNRSISSSQTSLFMKAEALPCECQACLKVTVLYSLFCSLMSPDHYFSWWNETLHCFLFFYHLLLPLLVSCQFLSPTAPGEQERMCLPQVIKHFVTLAVRNLALLVYKPLSLVSGNCPGAYLRGSIF